MRLRTMAASLFALATTFASSATAADPLLPAPARSAPASTGKSDVATEGFASSKKLEDKDKDKDKDATTAELSAGGIIASGNSRQVGLTASGSARVRRSNSQGRTAIAINYAEAAAARDRDLEPTVSNLQGLLRYDYFFAERWAAFLQVSARRDRFQGLNLRLNIDPGIAHYLIDEAARQLRVELGYDLQYDVRRDENLAEARAGGEDLDKTEVRHSARAFVGYDDTLNERVTFSTGLEYIQSVTSLAVWRLGWISAIKTNLAGRFSSAVVLDVRYDSEPLPGIEELDIVTSFQLVYTLL
jgi:putative salt-induced outer membrane protein